MQRLCFLCLTLLVAGWCFADAAQQNPLTNVIAELPKARQGKMRTEIRRNWSQALLPGKTWVVAELKGAGVITHWQITMDRRTQSTLRQVVIRAFWDEEKSPSILCPIGDFFCDSFGGQAIRFASLLVGNTSGAWHCYWPMPFSEGARIEVLNESQVPIQLAYELTYLELAEIDPSLGRFHAHFRRENPTKEGEPYLILDLKGKGHYCGLHLQMQSLRDTFWFLEGNTEIYVDGEQKPSLENVGTEDYFNGGWYFADGLYIGPWSGLIVKSEHPHRIAAYRFLVQDAIPFTKSIRVTIHHGEHDRGEGCRADYASVAYWYQFDRKEPLPALPLSKERLVTSAGVGAGGPSVSQ